MLEEIRREVNKNTTPEQIDAVRVAASWELINNMRLLKSGFTKEDSEYLLINIRNGKGFTKEECETYSKALDDRFEFEEKVF